jgi:CheY-like chemotaxis protein/anti-sigma regulatory factor (Ser/Thr protein kinase)
VLDPKAGPVLGDAARLQQIVWNLLSNAIKFTPQDGHIDIRARRSDDDRIEITVRDTGAGIPAEFLPYVFDRFRQADAGSRRQHGGLGLGLAIVRHLVELHGGTVSVTSDGEGKGATFRVVLPVRLSASTAAAATRAAAAAPDRASDILTGIHALVVDDEADSRDLFSQVLQDAGARVSSAPSAGEAMTRLLAEDVDVLLSDIEMPEMDGYELIGLLRADPRLRAKRIVAVALTAYTRHADRDRALEAGYDAHLAKPVDPGVLLATVASLIAAR